MLRNPPVKSNYINVRTSHRLCTGNVHVQAHVLICMNKKGLWTNSVLTKWPSKSGCDSKTPYFTSAFLFPALFSFSGAKQQFQASDVYKLSCNRSEEELASWKRPACCVPRKRRPCNEPCWSWMGNFTQDLCLITDGRSPLTLLAGLRSGERCL